MIETLSQKVVAAIEPGAIVENAAAASIAIDTIGFARADLFLMLGTTDDALTVCNVTECDTIGGAYTAVPGADFSTGTNVDGSVSTLPGTGASNEFFGFSISLLGNRKRFLKLNVTAGATSPGAYMAGFAVLSRAQQMPYTMAQRGLTEQILIN